MDIDVDLPFPNEISNTQPKRALEAAAARFIPFGFRAAAETSLDEGNAFVCEISWSM